jgi:hypothetical protein
MIEKIYYALRQRIYAMLKMESIKYESFYLALWIMSTLVFVSSFVIGLTFNIGKAWMYFAGSVLVMILLVLFGYQEYKKNQSAVKIRWQRKGMTKKFTED